jgi:hypothetical protein
VKWIVPTMLVLVALIHLPPLLGVLGAAHMESAYGVPIADPNLAVLMRHRAVLFGLVGSLMLAAVFVPSLRAAALLISLLSAGSFVLLAWSSAGLNANLGRVAMVDVAAVVFSSVGLAAWWVQRTAAAGA